jgi:hypothetical protein
MKTWTVYRVENENACGGARYKPVLRSGKPVTFKKKPMAEKWLVENPPKTTAKPAPTFEVRRTIKGQ